MADTAMTDAPAVVGTGAVVTSAKKKAAEFEVLEARVSELLAQAAASPAQLTEVVEALLSLEKTQRLARAPPPHDVAVTSRAARSQDGDVAGTKLTVVSIVRACFAAKAWPQLNENVLLLSKRRSQLKQARLRGTTCRRRLSSALCAGHHLDGPGMHDLPRRHAGRGHQGGAHQSADCGVGGQGALAWRLAASTPTHRAVEPLRSLWRWSAPG